MSCKAGGQMPAPFPRCAQPMTWCRTLSLVSTRQEGGSMTKFTFEPLAVPDLVVIKPTVYGDARGFFLETYRADEFAAAGITKSFVHGFLVLSPEVDVAYQCDEYYHPEDEGGLLWNDPTVGIAWPIPIGSAPVLSGKDQQWPTLAQWEKR